MFLILTSYCQEVHLNLILTFLPILSCSTVRFWWWLMLVVSGLVGGWWPTSTWFLFKHSHLLLVVPFLFARSTNESASNIIRRQKSGKARTLGDREPSIGTLSWSVGWSAPEYVLGIESTEMVRPTAFDFRLEVWYIVIIQSPRDFMRGNIQFHQGGRTPYEPGWLAYTLLRKNCVVWSPTLEHFP